jgi:hypothetical protein
MTVAPALLTVHVNFDKWLHHNIRDYSVIVTDGASRVGPYQVGREVVRDGQVISSSPPRTEPAIDRAFDAAISCAIWGILSPCHIEYDETYGYPAKLRQEDAYLGTRMVEITDFQIE